MSSIRFGEVGGRGGGRGGGDLGGYCGCDGGVFLKCFPSRGGSGCVDGEGGITEGDLWVGKEDAGGRGGGNGDVGGALGRNGGEKREIVVQELDHHSGFAPQHHHFSL